MAATVYLAGPEVFWPDPERAGRTKKAVCAAHGLRALYPMDTALDLDGLDPAGQAAAIFHANVALMEQADALIANLTPFRGPGCDPGTAFEVGFMHAQGKPVFAYSTDARDYAGRVRPDGMVIEDFGLPENLMLAVPARAFVSGGEDAFARCVALAAAALSGR